MRVVFDNSSLLAACIYPERKPAKILSDALLQHQLFASYATLSELEAVLARPKFDRWMLAGYRQAWFQGYVRSVTQTLVEHQVADCRDGKDDIFLSLALAAKAEVIVSSDDDLLVLHPYRGIDVLALENFKKQYLV